MSIAITKNAKISKKNAFFMIATSFAFLAFFAIVTVINLSSLARYALYN
jgi:hypothetical protein